MKIFQIILPSKLIFIIEMNHRHLIGLVLSNLLAISSISIGQGISECKQIVEKMISSIEKIETLSYTLNQNERINGEMIAGKQDVKLSVKPFKVYIYSHMPNEGAEVLWVTGKNGGDALVNPRSFPYINLNLDPYGSLLRKDQHHTLHKSGFNYLKDIIEFALDTAGVDFGKYFSCKGLVQVEGRACYKVIIEYDQFNYLTYTVKKGQTVLDIAQERMVNEYMIISINSDVDDYDDVKEGQLIKIPIVYAKKTILYIDKINYLPIKQVLYDDKGLFEKYRFSNLKINPTIYEVEFTQDYKDYDF